MTKYTNTQIIFWIVLIFVAATPISSFGQNSNIAYDIFNSKTLIIPNMVQNFVILIPNEAHESPELPKDQRIINQPYVPQNLVASPNTKIIWFNGDVGHTRKVKLTDENSNDIFNSVIHYNSASNPISLKNGKFSYFESNVNKEDPKYQMTGTIVIQGNNKSYVDINNNSKLDSMAILMIPTTEVPKYSDILLEDNVNILDQYSFKDLRETGGGGSNQTLLVVGSANPIDMVIPELQRITSMLPYS